MLFEITARENLGPIAVLTLRSTRDFNFKAGQYVVIRHPHGGEVPMSLASAPRRLPYLILHYRSTPGVPEAVLFDDLIARGDPLDVTGPFGDVFVDGQPRPDGGQMQNVLLIAGGTGASQATSILEHLRDTGTRPATLYWSVAAPLDLYQDAHFARLAYEDWFDYRAFIDDRRGQNQLLPWLAESDLSKHADDDVVLCGPPAFVYAALDTLTTGGLARGNVRSDVFGYAPREA